MDQEKVLNILQAEVAEALEKFKTANARLLAVTKEIPSGLPHPDGVQRIVNVSAENARARKDLRVARARLEQFREYGFVPDDLR
jgi:hypothetical protein